MEELNMDNLKNFSFGIKTWIASSFYIIFSFNF